MLTIAQTLRGRSWKTCAERMYEKRAEDLCGFHILFRMLGVQGLDKSDFSYN